MMTPGMLSEIPVVLQIRWSGKQAVPLTDMEMKPLGIKTENVEVDFAEGDTVTVIGGVWKDTVGVIQSMNHSKQIVTINVELWSRNTSRNKFRRC